jgi:glutamate-1-semialdehyde aminotransferase
MYPDLQRELSTFERRTPKSAEAHKKNLKRIPLGVASNYRAYDPWPIFVKEASGSKFRDLDGNEYIDHNLTFGAQFSSRASIETLYDMATVNGARIMRRPDYGLEVGAPADLVVVDAPSVQEAYRTQPPRLAVIHDGRVVARNGRVVEAS